ncbi:MAG: hypothetical protein I3J03_06920 [Actinomyces succiniciruminis]|nr:hypothetical protein [Actinomyces succiniciruminis]
MATSISRRSLLVGASAAFGLLTLGACGKNNASGSSFRNADATAFPTTWSDTAKFEVFDGLANQAGEQPGWFGKMVSDRYGLTLNLVSPNVAGGGDTLYNTRVTAGNLGDIVVVSVGKQMNELIDGGLLMDFTPVYGAMKNVARFDAAVQKLNEGKDGLYGLPTQISTLKPTEPSEGIDPTFGPFVRWDLYKQIGYPEIPTLEDLLPVLQQMQEAQPTADNGKKTYAISLFKDWDGNMMNNAKQPVCYYGYDEIGFVLAKADGSDFQGILDDDGQYRRVLKWFFDANQLGIVDPDSTTQNYDTLFSKMQAGQVLFSFWPWQGQSAYNTEEHMAAGKGFEIAPLADMKVFSYGAEAVGGQQIIAIGSQVSDPDRAAAFLDWLYSSEGVSCNSSQTMGAAGPRGLTWDINADGKPELTDFGRKALLGDDADVPSDWGTGTYKEGASWLNVTTVLGNDIDPETGYPFNYKMWETYQETTANPLSEDWSAKMGGATTTMQYLQDNDMLAVAPGASYVAPDDDSQTESLRNQVKSVIVESSWKMAFASDEAEFDSLWEDLKATADGLGYQDVLEVDMANAKDQQAAREEIVAQFG